MNKTGKVLVTGGAGFIGSHIVDRLVDEGFENIHVVDNYLGSTLQDIYRNPKCQYTYLDVADMNAVDRFFEKNDFKYVFHIAANGNVPLSNDYPTIDFNSNCLGAFNVLNCCVKYKVEKVLYSSTAAVYGNPKYPAIDENHPLTPISNYGVTKLYGERLGIAYHHSYGLNFVAMRIFNTYGPRQPRYVLYDLIRKLNNSKETLEVLGTGEQVRDYSYISDTVHAFYLAFITQNNAGEVYNISGGNPISIKQLVQYICEELDINPEINYTGQSWKGDISILNGSIEKIRTHLQFEPRVKIHEGLKKSIQWFQENNYI